MVGEKVQAGSPTLSAPATATAGETIFVTGAGFEKNTQLQVTWDGSDAGMPTVRADVRGELAASVTVPGNATSGAHLLGVSERQRGNRREVAAAKSSAALATTQLDVVMTSATPTPVPSAPPPSAQPSSGSPTPTPQAGSSSTSVATPTLAATASPSASAAASAAPTPVAAASATPPPAPAAPVLPPSATRGIWLSAGELLALPTSGGAWDRLVSRASGAIPREDLSCQDATASQVTMAAALVAARTNDQALRGKVRDELMRIMGTENGSTCGHPDRNRPLGVGRNLAPYVISADLIGFREFDPVAETTWRAWLSALRSAPLAGAWALNSTTARNDHSNWGAHQAAALTAADAYLGDTAALALDAAWARAWVDPTAPMPWSFQTDKHDYSWSSTGIPPAVPVNPAGAVKDGVAVDGIPLVDMQRGGGFTTGAPVYTQYPREALVGRTVQFEILARAGYPAYSWGGNGLLRVAQRLLDWSTRWDASWYEPRMNAYWILSVRYGVALPRSEPAVGRQVVGTDWTHRGG
jgi:hypothetical protein